MRHVLLANDDGVFAPGLRALADAFLSAGWRVSVCAPDQERSGAAQSLTFKRPLVVSKTLWQDVQEGAPLQVWKTDGMPADCVKIALHALCEEKPDIVVSGINNGWNVGMDVLYSGTVGAAAEAAFEGMQSLAVSTKHPDAARYAYAASLAVQVAGRILKRPLPDRVIANLNTPDLPPAEILGLVEAPMTPIRYTDAYACLPYTKDRAAYWLRGEIVEEGLLPDGDLDHLTQGYATLTAIGWDRTVRGACRGLLQD